MASLPNTKLVTYQEWLQMPEVKDEEVVNGEIRIMPPAKARHARIVSRLHIAFANRLDLSRFDVLTSSFGVVISVSPLTCRNPDLAIFDRITAVEIDGFFRSAPELAVEVLSPRNTPKDMRLKTGEYGSLGLPELWIVSPEARTVEVLLLAEGVLRRSALISGGVLRPTKLPQVEIDVASIWPE